MWVGPSRPAQAGAAAVEPRFVDALHLAWAASRGQSLFAARCLVATALELHARGASSTDVQLALAFAGATVIQLQDSTDKSLHMSSTAAVVARFVHAVVIRMSFRLVCLRRRDQDGREASAGLSWT